MFRCARLYDLSGDDEQAIGLYEQLAESPRAYVNALLNLAVIYEDLGDYEEALRCLQRVLKAYPNHTRARLFFKDVESCRDMIVEEAGDLQIRPRDRLLDTPLSDFELSVRARNCLKKMNIRSLGDLVRLTEAELLSYKNFGDTSLSEIKALLSKRGLRLGQAAVEPEVEVEQPEAPAPAPAVNVPPGHEAILNKPVSELELSVRARRCLQRLNVISIGDLIQLSDAELLATRNFGVTSLNEVKGRLTELGLQLASKPAE
jgi:DNA-directed RNA polymerase subunit alpha